MLLICSRGDVTLRIAARPPCRNHHSSVATSILLLYELTMQARPHARVRRAGPRSHTPPPSSCSLLSRWYLPRRLCLRSMRHTLRGRLSGCSAVSMHDDDEPAAYSLHTAKPYAATTTGKVGTGV